MWKKSISVVLSLVLICALSACGKAEESTSAKTERLRPLAAGNDYIADGGNHGGNSTEDDGEETNEGSEEAVGGSAATIAEGFDEAYCGAYSDTQNLLLAFDSTNGYGLAAITNSASGNLEWVCMGESSQADSKFTFSDEMTGNVFEFTVEDSYDTGIEIGLQNGYLDLQEAELSMVSDFFAAMEAGEFS